jgi:aryl-alcohol dehydrogenase-like predicted oxidoreductase
VGAIGLGCMGMSWAYGPADTGESVATIQAALDAA